MCKGLGGKDKTTEVARQTLDGKIIKVTKKAKGKLTDASLSILQNCVVVQKMSLS